MKRFHITWCVIVIGAVCCGGHPHAAHAMEQLLAANGWIVMETDAQSWSAFDADGDGSAEVCFTIGSGAQQALHAMKVDGTTVCILTLDKNAVCPACGPDWEWWLLSFGNVDAPAGSEAVVRWYDYGTDHEGVAVLSVQTGGLLMNFGDSTAEAVLDLDGNGSQEVILEYDTPVARFEVWGYDPLAEGIPGAPGSRGREPLRVRGIPNPASGGTRIVIQTGAALEAGVRITDASGRLVRDLGVHRMSPGANEITWDGNDGQARPAAAGVYGIVVADGSRRAASTVVRLD